MAKKLVLTVFAVLVVIVALVAVKASQIFALIEAGENFVPPPESVEIATAQSETWTTELLAVGTVVAVREVSVTTENPGIIRSLHFSSGDQVKAGQILVRLDTSVENAQLQSALAAANLAKVNLERNERLRKRDFATKATLDASEATAQQSDAQVAQAKAVIDRRTIRAPFAGRVGIRQVNPGQYLNPGDAVVDLVSLSPVYVDFSLPQRHLAVLAPGLKVRISVDAFPDEEFEGDLESIDSTVDPSSRNVRARATLSNTAERLRPGMFVDVHVNLGNEHPVVLVPATAVLYAPYGNSVFVVENDDGTRVAKQRFVRVGERRGDFVVVESGVKEGELVVSAGAFKLRNGSSVVEGDDATLDPKLAPDPTDT